MAEEREPSPVPVRRPSGTGWPEPAEVSRPAAGGQPRRPSPRSDRSRSEAAAEETTEGVVAAGKRQRRPALTGLFAGLLVGLLGFGFVVQMRSNSADPALTTQRQEDLVRILDELDGRRERLRDEIGSLEERKRQLSSDTAGREAALDEARRRAEELGILAGTLPAEGPGLEVRFRPRDDAIRAVTVLDAVQELRGAGAEAMQIAGDSGAAVRIVASTYFVDADGGLEVDGQRLRAPYTLLAIGDPQTMHAALNIPGGVLDAVRKDGGTVDVHEPGVVRVSALRRATTPKYARPAS